MQGFAIIMISFVICLALSVPISISIGCAILTYIATGGQLAPMYLASSMFTTCDSFPLLAIPGFILSGALMEGGGLSKRLVGFCDSLIGQFTGGLAIVTVVTCMFFGAISGSAPATVASIGSIMIPAMLEKGYERNFSVALVAASGILGIIIPPSIPMVIYGVTVTESSVGSLFMGGFGPGILCSLFLALLVYFISKKSGFKGNGRQFSLNYAWQKFKEAIGALVVPVIILGGIYGGIFTPTEASVVAVFYALIAGKFIYKELTLAKFKAAASSSVVTVGSVLIIVSTATIMGRAFAIEKVPIMLSEALIAITDSKLVLLLLINLLLLIVGCILETSAAIMILAPILVPVVLKLGVDPTHFGVMMIVNLGIGMITPPVGVNLFVASGIGSVTFVDLCKKIWPFIIVMIAALVIITLFPPLTTWLPSIVIGNTR